VLGLAGIRSHKQDVFHVVARELAVLRFGTAPGDRRSLRRLIRVIGATATIGAFTVASASGLVVARHSQEPRLHIVKRPDRYSRLATARFSWHTDGAKRTVCRRDHRPPRRCSKTITYRHLSEGTHTFRVRAYAGSTFTSAKVKWKIDRTAPTVPVVSGGSASWVSVPTVVSASGATDAGSGVAGYQYRRSMDGGGLWSSPVAGSAVDVTQDGTTWVQFRAVDGAGNVSGWSPATEPDASSSVLLDGTAPSVPVLSGGGGWVDAAQVDVTASGSVDVLSNPVGYQFETSADGGLSWSGWTSGSDAAVTAEGQTLVRFRAVDALGNASAAAQTTVSIDRTAPTVALTSPANGATVTGSVAIAATAADAGGVSRVDFLIDGNVVGSASGAPYSIAWSASSVSPGSHSITARAVDGAGHVTTSATVSVTVTTTPTYFSTLPSQAPGLPRMDSYCQGQVTTDPWEPRPDNLIANQTVPLVPVAWSNVELGAYWSKWIANRDQVTGNFTGTTNQIIQWAACKWGLDENLLRAVAVQESDWHESMVGDNCGTTGRASYGLFQIKNAYCGGGAAWGGYPYTAQDSALNADFYGAYIRSCVDNDFYDGGSWLYNGQSIAQISSARGYDYAVWGCVGSWFSGSWYDSGAQSYIASVKGHLSGKDWLAYGN
jgi:hypothetical protein